jgi:AcrR family transcriptional regulator
MEPSSTTRETILQAACRVVIEGGSSHLTLETVARQAGVSKGGLLYHFPSKEALVRGMIEHLNASFNARIHQAYAHDEGPARGRWLRAFVRATFSSDQIDVSAGLLAAVALNPELLASNRANYQAWQQKFEADGLDSAQATIIRLAADGLWFNELLGLAPLQQPLRSSVFNALIEMTKE